MPVVSSESWLTRFVLFGNNLLHTCHNLLFCQPYFPPPLALSSYVQQPLGKHPFPKTESLVWWTADDTPIETVPHSSGNNSHQVHCWVLQITPAFLWLVFLIFKFFSLLVFSSCVHLFTPVLQWEERMQTGKKSFQVGVGDMAKYIIFFKKITILSQFFVMLVLLFFKLSAKLISLFKKHYKVNEIYIYIFIK